MRRLKPAAIVLFLVAAISSVGQAATVYVDVNSLNPGTQNGSQQYPYLSIQAGINQAIAGDEVRVAAGVYYETILMKSLVNVIGAGAGLSIIDGNGVPNSVVTFNGTRFNPLLEGFTIRNGKGDKIGTVGLDPVTAGGGIRIVDSGPRLKNLVIEDNVVDDGYPRGGGIYIQTGLDIPTISGTTIRNNVARSAQIPGVGRGGGIYITSKFSSVLITENVIDLNVSDRGGAIYSTMPGNSDLTLERNVISSNEASDGAAVFTRNSSGSSATIVNNLFYGNGSTAGQRDCDDADGTSAPGTPEICNDGIDNDCDPATPDIFDGDNDGFPCDVDCDDTEPSINPSGFEHCGDGVDNDCDGTIDTGFLFEVVLIEEGAPMTWLVHEPVLPDPGLELTWVDPAFDDTSWALGAYGVGYEDDLPGAINLIATTVPSQSQSVYTRTTFNITDTALVDSLALSADYDDGYVAWINGAEVYRSPEMPVGDPDWDTQADPHESNNGNDPVYGTPVDISMAGLPALVNGVNVLAIGVWNQAQLPTASTDMLLVPRLTMMQVGPEDSDCLCSDDDADLYACNDCDDMEPTTNPGALELCNDGVDNDCDVNTPDVFDKDNDTYSCVIDCDDTSAAINPGAAEIDCDGVDNDCNPGTPDVVDRDNDGANCTIDCDDFAPPIFPGQIEFCFDGVDNNCDGFIDQADFECSCQHPVDLDGDSYRCTDCNDANPAVNPGAVEICNDGIDNDCTFSTQDIFDADGDGENCDTDCQDFNPAVNASAIEICNDGIDNDCDAMIDLADPDCAGGDADMDGYAAGVDCNDADPAVNPGAVEICDDGIDNDCDVNTLDLADVDGDGEDCRADCDDGDPAVNPDAIENCDDLIDNDCNGFIDAVNPDLVLVEFGSTMKYLANESDPGIGLAFTEVVFDDALWNSGLYGVGYQFGFGGVESLALTKVPIGTVSVYTRADFEAPEPGSINAVLLGADYDDGYVAWINGVEVYRSPEMPAGPPTWDANPALHESSNGFVPDYGTLIDITSTAMPLIQKGTNLLAVAVYNEIPAGGGNSSDLVVVPKLSLNFGDDDPECLCPDLDQDGYACSDCDDTNSLRNPGLPEIGCDLIDNDCDNQTDDDADGDGDGVDCLTDCNDKNPTTYPGAPELACDGINNDCNAGTSDIFDVDGDGYDCDEDCDETDPLINPGRLEAGCDGIDNDCNSLTPDLLDEDFDGYQCNQDCDDTDPAVNPEAFEKCNDGIDNDCDTFVDGPDDADCTCNDGDDDGYECQDCNDADAAIHPAMPELCNDMIDNDCDAATPDVGDVDGDGFDCLADCDDSDPFVRPNGVELCNDGIDNDCDPLTPDIVDNDADTYTCDVDCNDNDSAINPGATEVCNDTIDNDCNPSTVDIGDLDTDGVICTFDCDDGDPTINPDVPEICNDGIDNDCNPLTPDLFDGDGDGSTCEIDCDDTDPTRGQLIPEKCDDGIDNDCDGATDTAPAETDCDCGDLDGDGYSCADCDDTSATSNPGAPEICNDGIDNDCDPGTLDVDDLDGDGFLCTEECDDTDPLAVPTGQEICNDGIDNDCDPGTPDVFDNDADGYPCDVDCDDDDPLVNPGATEIGCDTIDNDCDLATPDLSDVDMDGVTCVDASVRGGAIAALAQSPPAYVTIVNNTFYDNSMPSGIGGAVYLDDMLTPGGGLVANNIFSNNVAELGGAMVTTFFYGDLTNNDFHSNAPADLYDAGGSGMTSTGNLFIDPQFASAAAGNFRLAEGSPLIDAADPSLAPTNDIDRFERPYDGDDDQTALPDLGAFEFPSAEVFNILFVGPDSLTWDVDDPGHAYNIYRAGINAIKTTGAYTQRPGLTRPLAAQFCEVSAAALPFTDTFDPANSGVAVYYLVTRRAASFEGSLGNDSSGALRLHGFPCP